MPSDNFFKRSAPDLIIAIGGGSVLDYAKIANVLTDSKNIQEEITNATYNHDPRNSPYRNITIMNYLVTGLICSGKSTFLDIAKKYDFDTIKSDDIVSSLYNDESIVHEIEKHLSINQSKENLEMIVKKLSVSYTHLTLPTSDLV